LSSNASANPITGMLFFGLLQLKSINRVSSKQILFLIRGSSSIAKIEVKDIAQRMKKEFLARKKAL
jgi:hypothetical protein